MDRKTYSNQLIDRIHHLEGPVYSVVVPGLPFPTAPISQIHKITSTKRQNRLTK